MGRIGSAVLPACFFFHSEGSDFHPSVLFTPSLLLQKQLLPVSRQPENPNKQQVCTHWTQRDGPAGQREAPRAQPQGTEIYCLAPEYSVHPHEL
ncbi:uncharacterized [Tachysurus ichikawai]